MVRGDELHSNAFALDDEYMYDGDSGTDWKYERERGRGSIYDLGTGSDNSSGHDSRSTPHPPEWRDSEHILPDGSVTRLLSIHSAEHYTFQGEKEKIVLICSDEMEEIDLRDNTSVKLRWLHVQNCNPKIKAFEELVTGCPFLNPGLRTAALTLISRISDDAKDQSESKLDVELNQHPMGPEEDRAMLIRSIYLTQPELGTPSDTRRVVRSLLSYLYGNEVATQRDSVSALRKISFSHRPGPLQVPKLLCLVLGAGLIITMSELDLEEINSGLIEINKKALTEFRTIQVKNKSSDKQPYQIVIEPDCKYVDVHRHVVAIATAGEPDPSRYDILWAREGDLLGQQVLTPVKWIQLLSSDTINDDTFFLSPMYQSPSTTDERWTDAGRDQHAGSPSQQSEGLWIPGSGSSEETKSPSDQKPTDGMSDAWRMRGSAGLLYRWSPSHIDRIKGIQQVTPESSGLATFPFFTWRVKHGTKEQAELLSQQGRDKTVYQILTKIHESITSPKSGFSTVYTKAYRCTANELVLRNPGDSGDARHDETSTLGSGNVAVPVAPREGSSEFELEGQKDNDRWSPSSAEEPSPGIIMKKQLLEVSQSIFRAFLPSRGAHQDYNHPLCEHLWGSLDEIFRQITWSTTPYRDELHCVVRDFDLALAKIADLQRGGSKEKKKFADCEACTTGHVYKSASDAIRHVHRVHFSCTATEHEDSLHDDPCSVWIKKTTADFVQDTTVLQDVQNMIGHLYHVSGMLNEIQWMVVSAAKGGQEQTSRPPLPNSLVHAFEKLLHYYVLTAMQLSLKNRPIKPANSSQRKLQLQRVANRCEKVGHKVIALLADVKEDLLVQGTKDAGESALGIQAVGAQFLAAALLTMVQNRTINLPPESGVQTSAQGKAEVLEVYKRYDSQIHFEGNRRPQRRVFLAIHELEEELRAIMRILASQRNLLEKYPRQIKPPDSDTGISYEMRRQQYPFEEKYIEKQVARLTLRQREINKLQSNAEELKSHVREMIEILDEDHGKAIRVFTIVTLFFLPLSFVTSFMGMNTSDLRDMDSNQQFWAVGIPLTVLVLAIAFIYGYKSEEFADLFRRSLQPRVPQEETTRTGQGRGQKWSSVDSEDLAHKTHEAEKAGGRLGRYLLRRRQSKREHQESVDV